MLIFGPPGTGKTTFLIAKVNEHLKAGVAPDKIAFISFTKKAAQEAQDRAPRRLIWFRTLHSMAFRLLNLQRVDVMQREHYQDFGEQQGLNFTGKTLDQGIFEAKGDNDILNAIHLARNKLTTAVGEAINLGLEHPVGKIKHVASELVQYREQHMLWDFTDMLEQFPTPPQFEVLIVDEAQDLTPLQWQVVDELRSGVPHVYIAGDDDQGIYEWCGADVNRLIDSQDEVKILDQSYRVPRAVQQVSDKIVQSITHRVEKTWKPRDDEGVIELGVSLDHIVPKEGTWMFLARTNYACDDIRDHLRNLGYLYKSAYGLSVSETVMASIKDWEQLRKGGELPSTAVLEVYGLMVSGHHYERGAVRFLEDNKGDYTLKELREHGLLTDDVWFNVMTKLGKSDIDYIRNVLANGEKKCRCYVGTIHSVKGGEADNVVLATDVPQRVDPHTDAERRVWYVGATRARKTLHVLRPLTNFNVSLMFS